VEILGDQQELIRAAILAGLEAGHNPRKTALELVGRVDRTAGRRKGGLIGLTSKESGYVRNMRAELSDPKQMGGYFSRKLRDRRFDATVAKARREGRALSQAQISRITGRYSDRLLKERGDRIARSETIEALNAGRNEGMAQLIERGEIPADAATSKWDATGDKRTRLDHMEMDGQEVPFGQPFKAPDGDLLMFPGDTSLGAQARHTINCRCYAQQKINWLAMAV